MTRTSQLIKLPLRKQQPNYPSLKPNVDLKDTYAISEESSSLLSHCTNFIKMFRPLKATASALKPNT